MRKGISVPSLFPLETLRRRLRYSKRLLVNRRGDGVHSPFAFHFLSKVVRNRRPFYCFEELACEVSSCFPAKIASRRRKSYELLFRTAHELSISSALHLGATTSPLEKYLRATGYLQEWRSVSTPTEVSLLSPEPYQLLIIEDPTLLLQLPPLLQATVACSPRLVLAAYTPKRKDYEQWKALLSTTPPRLQIDLLDLQLAFYDQRLTPTRYKGIY